MKTSGRLSAAIEILEDFTARRVPLKMAITDWSRNARYAGAKDRAWISGLCLDALRKRNSLTEAMQSPSPRALTLGALHFIWATPLEQLEEIAAEEPHGPGALLEEERALLGREGFGAASGPSHITGDFPEWLTPQMARVFGDDAAAEGAALSARADIDLRLNTLKAEPEKSLAALASVKAAAIPALTTAARIAAPEPSERAPAVTIIPAFNKGWVEVQDLGSQIAAAASGAIKGKQVIDYCAGGGGKTLALAALMENTGQLYAYDRDARRLKPVYDRAKRAGVRNLQIVNPATDRASLEALEGKMDVVFIDSPCTGSGVWRRHPDSKWRLNDHQLERRMAEQDQVLADAAKFVRPGGRLVYVTCSVFMEENEDRLAAFIEAHPDFAKTSAIESISASGLLAEDSRTQLSACETPDGALRITPARLRADGFYIATLVRD